MATTNWNIDSTHSEVQFKVKHMMISTVTGQFNTFSATVATEENDFSNAKIDFTADVNSISTNNEQRDGHLKAGDFFDAENHPQISFKGNSMIKVSDDEFQLNGELTMRGVTKPISLKVEFGGIATDPWGMVRAGFTIEGKINRNDFGVSFSAVTEAGHILLSDDVRLHINAEFLKQ
jgi:polyisoprenoid-binding protein YceI